jgi:uncharacterized protein YjbJ (UPF0337 family)
MEMSATNGKVDRVKGNVKSAAGRATGDRELQAKGKAQKKKGSLKQAAHKTKEALTK